MAVLTSKHQKLELFQQPFLHQLNLRIDEASLDTDQLGTFSGEVERPDSPVETAIKKARMGIEATGIPLGLASEGSIGADPFLPWIACDYEIVVFLDQERDLVITESFKSNEIIAATIDVRKDDDLTEFLRKADFPHHALIVRSTEAENPSIFKGIIDLSSLKRAIEKCAADSTSGRIRIESDFRAMHSPSRRQVIFSAAELLAIRVSRLCPECRCPGWGRVDYRRGVPCSECEFQNIEAIREEVLGCYSCDFTAPGATINMTLDPARCSFCNP